MKKLFSSIIFSQNGMRLGEKGRKKFQLRIPFILDPGKKIPKKLAKKFKKFQKTTFRYYFQPKWDEIGREREKKILGPNSVQIGPRQGNSERSSKEIKKPLSDIIPKENWMRQAEKGRKNFSPEFRSYSTPARKFRK